MTRKVGSRLRELAVGGQLGHLEYVVTQENLALFRDAVDYPEAGFPSMALAEPARHACNPQGPVSDYRVELEKRRR